MALKYVCAAATVLLLGLFGPAARAESRQELYQKAKTEGVLTIYGGGPTRLYEPWIKEFEATFPGIAVNIVGGYAGGLAPKIDAEIAAHHVAVDFVTFQAVQDFVRWKAAGVLLPFEPTGFAAIDPRFRDPQGAFTTIGVFAIAPAYNTTLLSKPPISALDFLKPAFKGKLVSAYPADDDATLFAFMTIIHKYGWSFMDRYMANDPTFIQGHLGVVRAIVSGQKVATFDMMVHHTMEEKSEGHPIAVAFPVTDALPVWGQPGGIIRGAPHPNAAKLWLDWYMDPAQQRRIGTWSARTDVPPPFGLKPIFRYAVGTNLLDYVGDQPKLDALRKRFVGYTGEVKNQGGIQ